jgi:hypothetical protein
VIPPVREARMHLYNLHRGRVAQPKGVAVECARSRCNLFALQARDNGMNCSTKSAADFFLLLKNFAKPKKPLLMPGIADATADKERPERGFGQDAGGYVNRQPTLPENV